MISDREAVFVPDGEAIFLCIYKVSDLPFYKQSHSYQVSLPVQGIYGGVLGVNNAPISAGTKQEGTSVLC